jgi:hypothetical protein
MSRAAISIPIGESAFLTASSSYRNLFASMNSIMRTDCGMLEGD